MSAPQSPLQLSGVDAIKYLMAFCVVAIHFRANYIEAGYDQFAYPIFVDWLINLAVPFFFMATGFLIQRKLQAIESAAERRSFMLVRFRKTAKMWVLWSLIYLPLVIYYFFYFDYLPVDALKFYVKMMVNFGGIFCAFPLWYLYSLIFITLTVALLQPFRHYRLYLLLIFTAGILIRWLFPEPDALILKANDRLIGFAFGGGFPFIAGMLIYSAKKHISMLLSSLAILLSLAMKFYGSLPLIPQIGAIGLFGFSILLSARLSNMNLTGLRRQSMWIYFTHMIVIAFYFKIFELQTLIPGAWLNFALIETGAGLLAYALYRVEQTPFGRPLSKLL